MGGGRGESYVSAAPEGTSTWGRAAFRDERSAHLTHPVGSPLCPCCPLHLLPSTGRPRAPGTAALRHPRSASRPAPAPATQRRCATSRRSAASLRKSRPSSRAWGCVFFCSRSPQIQFSEDNTRRSTAENHAVDGTILAAALAAICDSIRLFARVNEWTETRIGCGAAVFEGVDRAEHTPPLKRV